MAGEIVKWRNGHITRAISVAKLSVIFEEYGSEGLTLKEIGDRMGSTHAPSRIMRHYPAIKTAYNRGFDGKTVDAQAYLMKRVTGFTKKLVSTTTRKVNGKNIEVVTKEEDAYYPPDVSAMRLMLKGLDSKRWGGDDDSQDTINIYLDKADSKL